MTRFTRSQIGQYAIALAIAIGGLSYAQSAQAEDAWAAFNPDNPTQIDHADWTAFLQTYLVAGSDGITRLRYGAVSDQDQQQLDAYIQRLEAQTVTGLNRDEQFAYWANLYNAVTVDVILEAYPVDSIRDIKPSLFSLGPWKQERVTVEGVELSLDDIEHNILRPIWQDPRVHYAVNCASIGCPNLMDEAFTSAGLEQKLDEAARAYVNHPRGASVTDGKLTVSSIYDWFKEDFGNNDAGVIAHLKLYANDELKAQLGAIQKISGDDYDWSLNEIAPGES